MNCAFINHTEYGLSPEEVNEVIQGLRDNWDDAVALYKEHNLPEGLQCVALHGYPTLHDYVDALIEERPLLKEASLSEKDKLKIALLIDNQIS
jgi:hypothetical protein